MAGARQGWRRAAALFAVPALIAPALIVAAALVAGPAEADQAPTPADCASTGVALQNGSFEDPPTPGTGYTMLPAAGGLPHWQTTDTAFELWHGDFQAVPAAQGSQHVELNATAPGTLYQAVATTPGTSVQWRFAHRARVFDGPAGTDIDTMELLIGPSQAGALPIDTFEDNDAAWGYHSGVYTVPAGQTTTVFAFRAVASASGSPASGNFLDDVSFATAPCVSLSTAIADDDGAAVQRGDTLRITVHAQNYGFSTADAVAISTPLPAQTTFVPGSLTVDSAAMTDAADADSAELAGGSLAWRIGSLAPGASADVSFQVKVDPSATETIATTSTAAGAWTGVGPLDQASSNTASVPLAQANLSTAKSAPGAVVAGMQLAFGIDTVNAGPDEARDVVVTDTVPDELGAPSVVADPAIGGTCSVVGQQATCVYPVLAAGATATTQVSATLAPDVAAGHVVANTAYSQARTEDPDLSDNTGAASAAPSTVLADLEVTLRAPGGGTVPVVSAGDRVQVSATVQNLGPSDSPGSVVVFVMDPAMRHWAVVPSSPAACVAFGARVVCTIGPLPLSASITFAVTGAVAPSAPLGPYSLLTGASVSSSSAPDPVPANDTAHGTAPLQIQGLADLGTELALETAVDQGGTVRYAVTTVNSGPSDATDVVVVTVAPDGVLLPVGVPDAAIPGGTCATQGQVVTCTYPAVRSGATVMTTVTGQATGGLTLEQALNARSSSRSSVPDPNGANDTARAALAAGAPSATSLARTGAAPLAASAAGALSLLLGIGLLTLGRCRPARRLG